MKKTRPAFAGAPLPLLVGAAAVAALSGAITAPAAVGAAPRHAVAETAAVTEMLDRLPAEYAVADATREAERRR